MPTRQPIYPGGKDTSAGAYSPGLIVGDMVFVSGQGPMNATGDIVGDTVQEQARQVLENVKTILAEADCTLDDVVKSTVHISDMGDFARFNKVYETFFNKPFPTRTTVQSVLYGFIKVEIDVIAIKR